MIVKLKTVFNFIYYASIAQLVERYPRKNPFLVRKVFQPQRTDSEKGKGRRFNSC